MLAVAVVGETFNELWSAVPLVVSVAPAELEILDEAAAVDADVSIKAAVGGNGREDDKPGRAG